MKVSGTVVECVAKVEIASTRMQEAIVNDNLVGAIADCDIIVHYATKLRNELDDERRKQAEEV